MLWERCLPIPPVGGGFDVGAGNRGGERLAASDREGKAERCAVLFDLLAEWAPEAAARTAILVENPAILYGFPKST
jgi:hypothetical protein